MGQAGSRELGMCLTANLATTIFASIDWAAYGAGALAILAAALGLGFIIFVHELGHFAVAKACGVKCHKFMIGFDVGGYKVGKQIGETYYGIGILPLGGYVQMMGQNDDPRMNEEQIKESEATVGEEGVETKEITGPDGKKHQVDARSYIAKNVPQRMAIISAGVIMNVIFAFVFAFIAFSPAVRVATQPSVLSGTDPGAPAWVAGLGAADEVVRVNDRQTPWYDQLRNEVMLSGADDPLELEVLHKNGETEILQLKSSQKRIKIPQIGVLGPISLTLDKQEPVRRFTPAWTIKDQIPAGSTIVAAAGQEVVDYHELQNVLVANASTVLALTLQPPAEKVKGSDEPVLPQTVTVEIPSNQANHVGLVMKMGPITAIQKGSPADKAGLKIGDTLTALNSKPIGMIDENKMGWNPRMLADELTALAGSGESVELTFQRTIEKETKTETISVNLRPVDWIEQPISSKSPASAPALGIAYYLLNEVAGIVPGSPAEDADVKPGDKITSVKLLVDDEYKKQYKASKEPVELNKKQQAWASTLLVIQNVPPNTKLEVEVAREGREKNEKVQLAIVADADHYFPPRGISLLPVLNDRYGESFGEQAGMAWGETKHALFSVYRFLNRIINRDIDPRLLGGPITIARASYMQALEGPGTLLLFLTLISANLAVVNFLPIPVLDGGHMVFLAYEGIFGRPPNEYFAGVMNLAGLAFIVCLMLFVFGLDLGLIDRNL